MERQAYVRPEVTSLTGPQIVEALGHPAALVYGYAAGTGGIGD